MPASLKSIRLLICVLFSGSCFPGIAAPAANVAELRALAPAVVAAGCEVRISGVVTYLRDTAEDFNFILDDSTGGVMVYPKPRPGPLQPGQRVTVHGRTQQGRLQLSVVPVSLEIGGMEALPPALPATLTDVAAGKYDGRFVRVVDVVRVVRRENPTLKPPRLALDLGPRNRRVTAWISRWEAAENRYHAGGTVSMQGVAVRWFNERSQPLSTSLLINGPEDTQTSAPVAARPSLAVADLLQGSLAEDATGPLTTHGVLTFHRPGDLLFIQDGARALRVRPAPSGAGGGAGWENVRRGQRMEITGFPVMGEYTTELEDAWPGPVEDAVLPSPLAFRGAGEILSPAGIADRDASLVSLPATVRGVKEREGRTLVELNSDGHDFTAWLPAGVSPAEEVQPDAVLQATGICTLLLGADARRLGRPPDGFSLLLAGAGALVVRQPAPWWTPQRMRGIGMACAGLTILTIVWAALLRFKNRALRHEMDARKMAESRLAGERRRVAADLHDTLEQTLIAAHLQLCAVGCEAPAGSEETSSPLSLARQLLARSRQEVREAVWDLHADAAQPLSLFYLLSTTCGEAATRPETEVRFTPEGEERPVSAFLITQSIRLVREAVANALKHAHARLVIVGCHLTDDELILSIKDDGAGFDPARAPRPETGHFGLTGIKERLQKLGGQLDLQSREGAGTTLTARIPIPPP